MQVQQLLAGWVTVYFQNVIYEVKCKVGKL